MRCRCRRPRNATHHLRRAGARRPHSSATAATSPRPSWARSSARRSSRSGRTWTACTAQTRARCARRARWRRPWWRRGGGRRRAAGGGRRVCGGGAAGVAGAPWARAHTPGSPLALPQPSDTHTHTRTHSHTPHTTPQVPEAVCLPSLTYHEAWELSYFGANVLHPRTTLPAMRFKIPIAIRNFFNLDAPGGRALGCCGACAGVLRCLRACTVRTGCMCKRLVVSWPEVVLLRQPHPCADHPLPPPPRARARAPHTHTHTRRHAGARPGV
jgi:hypothetical protein